MDSGSLASFQRTIVTIFAPVRIKKWLTVVTADYELVQDMIETWSLFRVFQGKRTLF